MAVAIRTAGTGLRKFIGPEAIRGFLRRGDVRGVLAIIGISELVDFIQGEEDKSLSARLPRYAIIDLHTQTIVKTLSTRKVYSLLTRPSRHRHPAKTIIKEVIVHEGHGVHH